jgi:hypothetical protein
VSISAALRDERNQPLIVLAVMLLYDTIREIKKRVNVCVFSMGSCTVDIHSDRFHRATCVVRNAGNNNGFQRSTMLRFSGFKLREFNSVA